VIYDSREEWCTIWKELGVHGSLQLNRVKNKGLSGPDYNNAAHIIPSAGAN
jgi:hypothetical protein